VKILPDHRRASRQKEHGMDGIGEKMPAAVGGGEVEDVIFEEARSARSGKVETRMTADTQMC
jgi:hypothetical protein